MIKKLLLHESGTAMLMVLAFIGLAVPMTTAALGLAGSLSIDSRVKTDILKRQYNALGVREFVLDLMGDPQAWEDWLIDTGGQGSITINGEQTNFTVVESQNPPGFSPKSAIKVKKEALVWGDLTSGGSGVEVDKEAVINGDINAGKDVKLKKESVVLGNVVAGGDVILEDDARVVGDITAGGQVQLGQGATVTGLTLQQQVSLPAIVSPSVLTNPFLSAGPTDVTVEDEQTYTLLPGAYGKLDVKKEGTLNLSAGHYSFEEFKAHKEAFINFDLLSGPVTIDVARKVTVHKETVMAIVSILGDEGDILFRANGKIELMKEGQYLGNYVTLGGAAYVVIATDSGSDTIGSFMLWYDDGDSEEEDD